MAQSNSGHHYAHPEPGEEVFITGIAGYFPKSNSVRELQENLFKKLDLISNLSELWKIRNIEIPPNVGKFSKHNRFDAKFFGFDYKTAHHIDVMSRLLLERTYEALIDAGVNPEELRNTSTGVYVATCFVETDRALMCDRCQVNNNAIDGCTRSNFSVRLAEWLGVSGPTYTVDTACSSSMYALDHAYKSIRDGRCNSAIVGGVNLSIYHEVTHNLFGMGLAAPDGKCKCFDESANGYVRSEAIAVCFLQKAKDSRRVHAQLVHVKTNCDGFKEQNILFPSAVIQERLLTEFYKECDISPQELEYLECHCTGTKAGDLEEMIAVDEVLCKNRSKPLLIGSVKSNMGHSEPVSGLCSLAKVCIAYNTGYIPPNINLWKIRKEITSIVEGRANICTDKQEWNRGYVAINNFGFGGANGHCLLKNVGSTKLNNGLPRDRLPRLVCVSGRTRSAVTRILRDLETRSLDVEEVRLWQAIHEKDIAGHNYRGYTILRLEAGKNMPVRQEIKKVIDTCRQVCFVYTYIDMQFMNMFSLYMEIPSFATAIQKCHEVLTNKGMNLLKLCTEYDTTKENHLHHIITVAIQIAITDVLKKMAVKPDYVIGEALGELCCAYADECFTKEQTILAAYDLAVLQKESKLKQNSSLATANGHGKVNETINYNKDVSYFTNDCMFFETARTVRQYLQERIPYSLRSKRWCYTEPPQKPEENNNYNSQISQFETNTIVIGVTSLNNFGNIAKREEITYVPLLQENNDNIVHFLQSWSRLFMNGLNPHLAHLYPSIQFPVSQGTPMLSHLVEWDHRENWYMDLMSKKSEITLERKVEISFDNHAMEYLKVTILMVSRVFYPSTGYLVFVWETLALTMSTTCDHLSVVFEDVRLERATIIPEKGSVELVIILQKVTGEFEITENDISVAKGRIYAKENVGKRFKDPPNTHTINEVETRMISTDIYKEMMLRGYGHSGLFQGILDCDISGTHSRIAWVNNWVVFLDNLFQMHIITNKHRSLLIPTRIEKISIDTNMHFSNIKSGPKHYIDVYINTVVNLIRSAGVEIRGLYANTIGRTMSHFKPTLESYEFISYFGKSEMQLAEVLQVYIQIIIENINISLFKSIEYFHSKNKNKYDEPITRIVEKIIQNIPNIVSHLNIISDKNIPMPEQINVLNESDDLQDDAILIIGPELLTNMDTVQKCQSCLLNGGFFISREQFRPDPTIKHCLVDIISIQNMGKEYLVLLRNKISTDAKTCLKVEMADNEFSWLNQVKKEIADRKVILYAQNEYTNGLIGLANCLRKEPDGANVSAFLITDPAAPPFDPDLVFYKQQIDKDLYINVFQGGQWGSYRHVPLKQKLKKVSHAYNHLEVVGDISTLQWVEGPLNDDISSNNLIYVYSSAMNFRDVMVATGRMHVNDEQEFGINMACPILGLEAVGRTVNGSRIMFITHTGFTNRVLNDNIFLLPVPDEWTFEEAATVTMVYSTVYVGFIMMGKMRAGESVLIHAGAGGVGQAAINVALHHGCEVFTTVGSTEKRALLKKLFPQLKGEDGHIGSSRDTSFEELIRRKTNGRGVDIVMNCLADDMLQASIRCLAYRGRFLEIGKYDIHKNTLFNSDFYEHEISFHSVMLDKLQKYTDYNKEKLLELLLIGIVSGAVRPLTSCSFEKDDIESAYPYMASGKHIGKVLIKIREEEKLQIYPVKPSPFYMDAVPRYICNPDNVFIIVGGLGGFGLELTNWLVKKSASKLVLVSSRGITNGYQKYRIGVWRSLGVNVQVFIQDVTSESACEELIHFANSMGKVEGIFNLAVILSDALFQQQTQDSYKIVYKPKAIIARNLDKLSRKLCPQLKDFVMFSSIACGYGNAGQTNYGLANSVMERICEQRKKEGLPALSIQWGLIGDVGIVAEMSNNKRDFERSGLSPQSISSCLQTLDIIMRQDATIVSSCVIAKKNTISKKSTLVDTIAKIKGIQDIQTISHRATLIELGMDSMMAVEIKQALERDYKIFLTPQEIRKLTFSRLAELSTKNEIEKRKTQDPIIKLNNIIEINAFVRNIGDEETASEPFIFMPSIYNEKNDERQSKEVLFMVPGFEGFARVFENLCMKLHIKSCVLQLGSFPHVETLHQTIERVFKVTTKLLPPGQPFKLLGYSFGVTIMLGLAAKLEMQGHSGVVFCLDGSPLYLKQVALVSHKDDKHLRNDIIYNMLTMAVIDSSDVDMSDDNEDIDSAIDRVLKKHYTLPNKYSKDFMKSLALSMYNRHWAAKKYKPGDINKIKSPIILLRAKEQIVPFAKHDYHLDDLTDNSVTVHDVVGNHADLPNNCAEILNEYLTKIRTI